MSDAGLFKAIKQYDEYPHIIPCKDCSLFDSDGNGYGHCGRTPGSGEVVKEKDFCSRAVRKENIKDDKSD